MMETYFTLDIYYFSPIYKYNRDNDIIEAMKKYRHVERYMDAKENIKGGWKRSIIYITPDINTLYQIAQDFSKNSSLHMDFVHKTEYNRRHNEFVVVKTIFYSKDYMKTLTDKDKAQYKRDLRTLCRIEILIHNIIKAKK